VGNLDCTLCLDCVRACPHDNIGLVTRVPAEELGEPGRRSGIGRLSSRPDLAALVVVFTFGALLNAFAMTAPALRVEQTIAAVAGTTHEALPLGVLFLAGLVLLPMALLALASMATRRVAPGERTTSSRALAMQYVYALVPLGAGIWAAHYGFHALTGALTVVPVTQSALLDLTGRPLLGEPLWSLTGASAGVVYPVQLGCLLLGTIGSLAVAHRISSRLRPAHALAASLPWAVLIVTLACAATWILGQPMDMRGVGMPG
jgi:ferredoxin